jgi:hypothetical protein
LTETERFLARLANDFRNDIPDILEFIGHFHREMARGLAGEVGRQMGTGSYFVKSTKISQIKPEFRSRKFAGEDVK